MNVPCLFHGQKSAIIYCQRATRGTGTDVKGQLAPREQPSLLLGLDMPTPKIPPPDLTDELAAFRASDEFYDAYFLALGKFIDAYGQCESILSYYLARYVAGMRFDEQVGEQLMLTRALLGSQRTKELSETIKRVLRLKRVPAAHQACAAAALAHLGHIQYLRDRIVHQSAKPEFHDGRWAVRNTNQNQVREASQIEEIYFTIEDLDDMSEDLWYVIAIVRSAMFPDVITMAGRSGDLIDQNEFPPFLYKPSRLKRRRPAPRTSDKAQDRQPEVSRE